jgi:hypothetical protein
VACGSWGRKVERVGYELPCLAVVLPNAHHLADSPMSSFKVEVEMHDEVDREPNSFLHAIVPPRIRHYDRGSVLGCCRNRMSSASINTANSVSMLLITVASPWRLHGRMSAASLSNSAIRLCGSAARTGISS